RDWFMVRTDFNGVVQWTQRRGGAGNEALRFLRQFPNGDFLQAGFVSAVGAGSIEGCLSRIDPMGNLVWMKAYGDTAEDWPRDVIFAANGDIVVAGVREDYLAAPTAFLMRTDSAGNVLWTRDINGSGTEFGQGVIEMPNGDLVMVGATNTAGAGQFDVLLIRTDAQGNLIWSKSFGGAQEDFGWSIALAADGNILISGWTRSIGVGDQDIFISKVDPFGNLLWTNTYGGPAVEGEFLTHEKSLIATPDGGGVRLASTASFGPGNLDLLLLKVDSMGLAECEVATNGFQPDTVILASTLIPQVETVINPGLGTDTAISTPVTFADSNFCDGPVVPPIVCTADASFSSLIG
ncbi:MAG: hypothetical protein AAGB22_15565, partial [Bacteroidota bacterium]